MKQVTEVFVSVIVAAFVVAGIVWFVVSAGAGGSFSAGDAFIGLGYLAAALAIALAALACTRLLAPGSTGPPGQAPNGAPTTPSLPTQDRDIVIAQLRYGAVLVAFGALIGVVFGVVLNDSDGTAVAMGTAVIGAGAALIPSGAAASASARILSTLPNRSPAGGPGGGGSGGNGEGGGGGSGEASDRAPSGEGEAIVDETEAYGSESSVTGLGDADLEQALSAPALDEQETEVSDDGELEDVEGEPSEAEAGVSSIAAAEDEEGLDEEGLDEEGLAEEGLAEDSETVEGSEEEPRRDDSSPEPPGEQRLKPDGSA